MSARRYPRTLWQAFGPYTDNRLHPMKGPAMSERISEFFRVYAMYRRGNHSAAYCARIAYGVAFRGCPF
jgi:hypothetical protein